MVITVAVVEDNAGICEELEQMLSSDPGFRCVCVCRNLQTALKKIPPTQPDIIIMDIQLPDGSGADGTLRLKRLLPQTQVVMFTIYDDQEQIFRALECGASGYLLKSTPLKELLAALREVRAGGAPMTGEVARKVIESFRRSKPITDPLTSREEEILQRLAKGHLAKEIAYALGISIETVNSHIKHIYEKLHVRSRTEAVIKYLQ